MPKLFLAPMEGVTDWVMRDLLTSLGGIDQCVTEFLRVTDQLYPDSVFYKNCPELKTFSKTRSGVPVFIQLLGGQAEPLTWNASRAVELGALGIDLNFGCPAKTVNRHDGGASLLKSTDRIFNIVKTVRSALPKHIPVTAKIRLGYDDPSQCIDNSIAVTEAGADWLTVHCRTKTDGYRPPAYWEWISKIKEATKIKIIANGEIWTTEDFKKCKVITGCSDFMIGRGALRNPYLFSEIKQLPSHNSDSLSLVPGFFDACTAFKSANFAIARTKQWLNQLSQNKLKINNLSQETNRAKSLFDQLKVLENPVEFRERIGQLIH